MALIKDGNGVAIVRFENGRIKTVNSSGEIVNTSNYAYTYNQHSGAGMAMGVSPSKNDTVLVKADASAAGNGYIFGNTNVNIRKNGTNMIWNIGGTDVATHAIESGFHVYGIVMDGTNEKMRAFYDGSFLDTEGHAPTTPGSNYYIGSNSTSGGASGVRIAEVMALVSPTSGVTKAYFHFYPTNGGNYYETRYYAAQRSATSTSSGTLAPYGITLDDVKYATGSKYKDLTAIVCEDGTPQTGADAADVLTVSGVQHNFAFALGDSGSGRPNKIPLPSGATLSNRSGDTRFYYTGDMILKRSPRWNIWNDSVSHGFYVWNSGYSDVERQLRFNIFKTPGGSGTVSTPIRLEWFENYSPAANRIHKPSYNTSSGASDWKVKFQNGTPCICESGNALYTGNGYNSALYVTKDMLSGTANAMIGNAIPWNLSIAQIEQIGDYAFCGFCVDVMYDSFSMFRAIDRLTDAEVAAEGQGNKSYCHSATPSSIKARFQSNYSTVFGSFVKYFADVLFDKMIVNATAISGVSNAWSNVVDAEAKLKLVYANARTTPASEIGANDLVNLSQLIDDGKTHINGEMYYGRRFMIDTTSLESPMGVNSAYSNYIYPYSGDEFFLGVINWNESISEPQGSGTQKEFFAKVEVFACSDIAGGVPSGNNGYTATMIKARTLTQVQKISGHGDEDTYRYYRAWINSSGTQQYYRADSGITAYRHYIRYLQAPYSQFFQVAMPDNVTFKIKMYDAASAPILSNFSGVYDNKLRTLTDEITMGSAQRYFLMAGELAIERAKSGGIATYFPIRFYSATAISATETEYQLITNRDLLKFKLALYRYRYYVDGEELKRGYDVYNFIVDCSEGISGSSVRVNDSSNTYQLEIPSSRVVITDRYWRNPDGSFTMNPDFFQFRISAINENNVQAGDEYVLYLDDF